MNRLVRTELRKQRTTAAGLATVASAPLVAALVAAVVLGAAGDQGNDPLSADSLVQVVGAPASVVTVIALLGGILGMAGEHRHGTITTTFLATPRRRDVVVAKLAAHALLGAAMAGLAVAASVAVAVPWLASSDVAVRIDGDLVRVVGGLVVATALHGAIGVAVGALVRNQTAAIAAVLIWVLALEGLVGYLFAGTNLDWLPAAASGDLVHADGGSRDLSVPAATVVLAAWAAGLAVLGTRLTVRRDIT